jgi:hypothetical protein
MVQDGQSTPMGVSVAHLKKAEAMRFAWSRDLAVLTASLRPHLSQVRK